MKILTINSGSSSLKYKIFEMPEEILITKGQIDNIGFKNGKYKNHEQALKFILNDLFDNSNIDINSSKDIDIIGHRVVHGGEEFHEPIIIDNKVISAIKKYIELAPLHNPANLAGIIACGKIIPNAKQIAIFDTAFHQTMKPENFLYALPYEFYTKYKIRKYGFHGISHQYVSEKAEKILKKDLNFKQKNIKLISCHVGNGASITAIKNGKVIENSLGLTTVSGLVMGTRSGDVDPGTITYLLKKKIVKNVKNLENILYHKSGVLGISGFTNNLKDIVEKIREGDKQSKLTLEIYINQIIKYIGAYTALMNGVDAIIFTAGVLEKSYPQPEFIREKIVNNLSYLGIKIDNEANKKIGDYKIITKKDSKIPIIVIPTNEELMIAKQSFKLINQ